jgi:purine-cytosine permease-like protein
MRFHHMAGRIFLAPALALSLAATVAACSSAGSSPAASTTGAATPTGTVQATASGGGSAAAVAAIKANWQAFFSSSTPNAKRVALLQNGAQFATAIKEFAASPLASAVTSKVDSVRLDSATKATVKYDLTAAGTTVASGQTGSAVLENGTWKVGDDIFCGLLRQGASLLNIKVPAACNSVG